MSSSGAARTILSRLSSSARSPSLSLKFIHSKNAPNSSSPLKSTISANSRLPSGSLRRSLVTMMPLHSAIALARLNSILSSESQSWGMIPQGISMPL